MKASIRWPIFAVTFVAFGLLMGLRQEVSYLWLRVLMASVAAMILVLGTTLAKRKPNDSSKP